MERNQILPIAIGIAAVGAVIGGTYAAMQSGQSPEPSEPVATETPTPSPTPTPAAQAPQNAPATPSPEPEEPEETPVRPSPSPTPSPEPEPEPQPETEPRPTVELQQCQTTMAVVNDPNPPLNVRSQPEVTENNIVGQLDNGRYVSVETEEAGWFKISNPVEGWIAKNRTKNGCNQKMARINFPRGQTSVTIDGELIGTGSHQYLLNAASGQTMTITSQEGALPLVFSPSDRNQSLNGQARARDRSQWRQSLPASGDYILELDSNFRGYEYTFTVEVK